MTLLLLSVLVAPSQADCATTLAASADLALVLDAVVDAHEEWPDYDTVFSTAAALSVAAPLETLLTSTSPSTQDVGYGVEAVLIAAAYGDAKIVAHLAGNVLTKARARGVDSVLRDALEAFSRVRSRDDLAEVLNTSF